MRFAIALTSRRGIVSVAAVAMVGGLLAVAVEPARGEQPQVVIESLQSAGVEIELGEPVIVAQAAPQEKRWGYFQFPKLSTLPDGRLLLTCNDNADDDAEYGRPGPAFVSADQGQTWEKFVSDEPAITISHSPISQLAAGEYLCFPFVPGMNIRNIAGMPQPLGEFECYQPRHYYLLKDCPAAVREYYKTLVAYRWTPATQHWEKHPLRYELQDALLWAGVQTNGTYISRTSFEIPLTQIGDELFFPEYKFRYLLTDGSVPRGMTVSCMVSRDNGHTFERRGTIAAAADARHHPSETALAATSDKRLVCVLRTSCGPPSAMQITFSDDRGKTWSPTRELHPFGVMPQLLSLDAGPLLLTFGRPGVAISVSADGSGRRWTEPIALRAHGGGKLESCGYTAIVPLGERDVLLAYSDFTVPGEAGKPCKSILVRRVKISKSGE